MSNQEYIVIVQQDNEGYYYEIRVPRSERDQYPVIDYEKAYAPEAKWK